MGRVKTTQIKRSAKKLMALHREKFSADFEGNKKAMPEAAEVKCKKLRNVLAGYIARIVKKQQE